MAIPTLLRQTDYTGVDFTDKAQGTFEVLKDALVDKFGWTLLFEDLASPDKSFVVSNTGSQSCLKITKESADTVYLKFESAQSYSDINTPVNRIQSCYYYFFYTDIFNIVGDSKRFYFIWSSLNNSYGAGSRNYTFFCGDILPFKENEPDVFYLTPSDDVGASRYDNSKNTSFFGSLGSSYVLSHADNDRSSNLNIYNGSNIECSILSPGAISDQLNNKALNNECPVILNEMYIVTKSPVDGFFIDYGKLPGAYTSATYKQNILASNMDNQETIKGFQFIPIPHAVVNRYNKGIIILNDWDVL